MIPAFQRVISIRSNIIPTLSLSLCLGMKIGITSKILSTCVFWGLPGLPFMHLQGLLCKWDLTSEACPTEPLSIFNCVFAGPLMSRTAATPASRRSLLATEGHSFPTKSLRELAEVGEVAQKRPNLRLYFWTGEVEVLEFWWTSLLRHGMCMILLDPCLKSLTWGIST